MACSFRDPGREKAASGPFGKDRPVAQQLSFPSTQLGKTIELEHSYEL